MSPTGISKTLTDFFKTLTEIFKTLTEIFKTLTDFFKTLTDFFKTLTFFSKPLRKTTLSRPKKHRSSSHCPTTVPTRSHRLQVTEKIPNFAAKKHNNHIPMRTNGFIHLHRSILAWNYHNNPTMLSVWTHLIMLAEYEDREQDGITIHRGELLVSQQWLAEYIGITLSQMRLCISTLEKTGLITKRKAGKITVIKILQYNEYQGVNNNRTKADNSVNDSVNNSENRSKERNINNNKKNLSDREIQKSDTQSSQEKVGHTERPEKTEYPEKQIPSRSTTIQDPSPCGGVGGGRQFFRQLAAHEGWKHKCCRDYHIEPSQMDRHIIAFHEHLLRNVPGKTWLSFNDFCLHFHSWLRFQTPESIKRLSTQAVLRSRQQKAMQIEQQRQQQMWQEIEDTKQKAVSYEEYLKNKHDPLDHDPLAHDPLAPQGGTLNSIIRFKHLL